MKKNAPVANATKTQESANLTTINLEKFADQLQGLELKEKKERETIYLYPAEFTKSDIGSEKGKKFRNSLRNQMKRLSNNILLFAKMKRMDDLNAEILKFDEFYTKNYRTHDYSLASVSQSNDPAKEKDLNLMMQILKEVKAVKA
jgi:hypothetical protein